jgi:hypothetical protein
MYEDEYHSGSKMAYDGELIDMQDALYRTERDRERQEKYKEAENALEDEQVTWSGIEDHLNR